jgi:hypothetical protein
MDWIVPSQIAPIATYGVMNSDEITETSQLGEDVKPDDVVQWYRNMLTGYLHLFRIIAMSFSYH